MKFASAFQSNNFFIGIYLILWLSGIACVALNIGANEGIEKNMPVISKDGLVGKVIYTGSISSNVQLLTDPNFKVAAKVAKSDGMFEFTSNNIGLLRIPKSNEVAIGDTVFTSGLGNIYPEGIKIGTVNDFEDSKGLYKNVNVKLFVDYTDLRQILVIKNAQAYFEQDSTLTKK